MSFQVAEIGGLGSHLRGKMQEVGGVGLVAGAGAGVGDEGAGDFCAMTLECC